MADDKTGRKITSVVIGAVTPYEVLQERT